MPAAKPEVLIKKKTGRTKADKRRNAETELSLIPIQGLPDMPAEIKGHKYAVEIWRRLMQLYAEIIAEVVTAFDQELLVSYCLTLEQIVELDFLRAAAFEMWRGLNKKMKAFEKRGKTEEALFISESVNNLFGNIVKLDARVDGKRKLAHQLAQSLYLTPRARAGAAPPRKPAQPEAEEMDDILNEAKAAAGV